MQWRDSKEFAHVNYIMRQGPNPCNPYRNGMQHGMDPFMGLYGMQPGMDPFMGPYGGGMTYMGGYRLLPMDVPFGGMFSHDPFGSPFILPQRDLAELGMGSTKPKHANFMLGSCRVSESC